jgi:hypothetical protein
MASYTYKINCTQYPNLFYKFSEVSWDDYENIIYIKLQDYNSSYIELLDILKNSIKLNIKMDVYMYDDVIRTYDMELVCRNIRPSNGYTDLQLFGSTLNATFKILKSEINFVNPFYD